MAGVVTEYLLTDSVVQQVQETGMSPVLETYRQEANQSECIFSYRCADRGYKYHH